MSRRVNRSSGPGISFGCHIKLPFGLPVLHAVFLGLLREQVGLRDLAGLVDALVGLADTASSAPLLIEHVRRA